jgi:hypothetical protein
MSGECLSALFTIYCIGFMLTFAGGLIERVFALFLTESDGSLLKLDNYSVSDDPRIRRALAAQRKRAL